MVKTGMGRHLCIGAAGEPAAMGVEGGLEEGGAEQAQQAHGSGADARGGHEQGSGQRGVGRVVQVVVQQVRDVLLPPLERLV